VSEYFLVANSDSMKMDKIPPNFVITVKTKQIWIHFAIHLAEEEDILYFVVCTVTLKKMFYEIVNIQQKNMP